MSRSTPLDWDGIKSAYLKGDMTVGDICRTYDVTNSALYRQINIENWQRRQSRALDIGKMAEGVKSEAVSVMSAKLNSKLDKTHLFQRFFRVVDQQMAMLEAKLNEGGDGIDKASNAMSRERDARTLASLVRLLEKLNDLEPEKQQQGQDTNTIDASDEGAAVRLRGELASRIHKLLQEKQG